MKPINSVVSQIKETIFTTISRQAVEIGAVNLGQGFPDFDGPDWIVEEACQFLNQGSNQYAPLPGDKGLRVSIQNMFAHFYDLKYSYANEICVFNGATEAIYCGIKGLINPGDEVIVFEPFYDSYIASIRLAGGIPVVVTLNAPTFQFDEEALEKAFSKKTKLVIVNTPHNPSGMILKEEKAKTLSKLIEKFDCYALCDEVYEFLTFDGHIHRPLATYPNMKERTLTISSTGKTFGLTGWKLGWLAGPENLVHAAKSIHQYTTFCANHPLQKTMARALERLPEYIPLLKKDFQEKRDLFIKGLIEKGFAPISPEGTYFTLCPIPPNFENDVKYCQWLLREKKVASIPPSVFYLNSDQGSRYIRFCFAKKNETLKKALAQL